ncbi:MAG TPA: TIGR03435 family protein [Bryobacteraceae bacterium]|jgi:uncharacterized protein (TIGR03435 family)|nr:TIGR03435 family protein [Bryobacteraceae bacterium]
MSFARQVRFAIAVACLSALCPHVLAADRFEVASVRPHDPKLKVSTMNILPGGEVSITGMTVRSLMLVTYGVRDYQIVGGPKWLDSAMFDIHAKSAAAGRPASGNQFFADQKARLQTLLADRFQLKLHREQRERPVYLLSIDKGGLKMIAEGRGHPAKPGLGAITPWKLFVTELSQRLGRPVVDNTNLDGPYFVRLLYSSDDGRPAGIGTGPLDPAAPGGPSIFSAVREQLGLLLKSGKAPVDVIVIDSVAMPSEN